MNQFTVTLKTDGNCVFCNLIGLQISEAGRVGLIATRPSLRPGPAVIALLRSYI